MIVYKIDKQTQSKANSQIRDMATALAAISPTLQTLQQVIAQQSASISSPSINTYRDELQQSINDAIELANRITDNSQKLAAVSDQAGKHLAAIEDHYTNVLQDEARQ